MRKAFTLIELLVVIAIIAILAAILFPVFAQAKVAAKKTQDISNQKNMGTAIQIYLSDYDDYYPLAYPYDAASGTFQWLSYVDTPGDWDGSASAAYHNSMNAAWPNNVRPYIKNDQILASPGANSFSPFGNIYTTATKNPSDVGYSYNTLLTEYSATAVADVAKLRVITNPYGNRNFKGLARPGSRLRCGSPGPCRYVASSPTCNGANGTWSELSNPGGASMWLFGQGMNATYADTHAKFTRVASGPTTASDFRNDFWAAYDANGVARWNEWQDTNFCHTLLFMPDFDYQNFGTPVFY